MLQEKPMRYPVHPGKCGPCSACCLVEYTPGCVSRLPEDQQYYQCIAGQEQECRNSTPLDYVWVDYAMQRDGSMRVGPWMINQFNGLFGVSNSYNEKYARTFTIYAAAIAYFIECTELNDWR